MDKSAFIKDLVIQKSFTNCNATIISIKANLAIDMLNINDYEETELYNYQ